MTKLEKMTTATKIANMVLSRAEVGLEKYGVSIDRKDLTFDQWAQHAIEELLDGAQYLERAKQVYFECKEGNLVKPLSYNSFLSLINEDLDIRDEEYIYPRVLLRVFNRLEANGFISVEVKNGQE